MSQVCGVVSQDVNIYDAREVMWAMTRRSNWHQDPTAELIPGVPWRRGSKAVIDATALSPESELELRLQTTFEDDLPIKPGDPNRRLAAEDIVASELIKVATLSKQIDGDGKAVLVDASIVAVFRDGDEIFAVENECPNQGRRSWTDSAWATRSPVRCMHGSSTPGRVRNETVGHE